MDHHRSFKLLDSKQKPNVPLMLMQLPKSIITLSLVMVILFCLPVLLSQADTFKIPLASMSKVTYKMNDLGFFWLDVGRNRKNQYIFQFFDMNHGVHKHGPKNNHH